MTIRVQKDRIQFDDYTLFATPTGFSFDGQIIASNFINFFQGSISGYATGGTQSGPAFPPATIILNTIDRFPFTADSNATDLADLSKTRTGPGGHSSTVAGYASAGVDLSAIYKDIDRFPFATTLNNAVSIGNLVSERQLVTGHSSATHGYTTGGTWPGPNVDSNVIERFSFATDENALDVGDLLFTIVGGAAQSSQTNGYVSGGGQNFPTPIAGYQTIQKFPFAANMNAFNVGNLTANTRVATGQSSTTHGYTSGGFLPGVPAFYTTISKFPFATDTNATSVGNLTQGRRQGAGQSSITSGYTSGGEASSPATSAVNTIDKFPFATDANATDVGDLAAIRRGVAGQQH